MGAVTVPDNLHTHHLVWTQTTTLISQSWDSDGVHILEAVLPNCFHFKTLFSSFKKQNKKEFLRTEMHPFMVPIKLSSSKSRDLLCYQNCN